jgi:hypothetical protein
VVSLFRSKKKELSIGIPKHTPIPMSIKVELRTTDYSATGEIPAKMRSKEEKGDSWRKFILNVLEYIKKNIHTCELITKYIFLW